MDPTTVEDYSNESHRLMRAWEDDVKMPSVCHNPWMLDWHIQTGASYHYADQYWKIAATEKGYGMYPILH